MPSLSKRERSIAAKFRRYEKLKERAKRLYEQADVVLTQIAELAKAKHLIRIDENGRQLQLRESSPDEKGILGWGHGAVRQFDPKVVNL